MTRQERDEKGKFIQGNHAARKLPKDFLERVHNNREYLNALFERVSVMTEDQLMIVIQDPTTPAVEKSLCKAIQYDIDNGTSKTLEALAARILGKPKEMIQTEGTVEIIVERKDKNGK